MISFNAYNDHSKQCELCLNLIERTRKRCSAFPNGIPPELWNDEIDHATPYPNDNGILFEENVIATMKRRKRQ